MTKTLTDDLIGPALDWAVAKAEGPLAPLGNVYWVGKQAFIGVGGDLGPPGDWVVYSPSTDWSQGGPIIERERLHVYAGPQWTAGIRPGQFVYGPAPLIAAMRCYVRAKLGDEVDVPDELLT